MSRKRYTAEQIIGHLLQAEIRTSEGKTIGEAEKPLEVRVVRVFRFNKR